MSFSKEENVFDDSQSLTRDGGEVRKDIVHECSSGFRLPVMMKWVCHVKIPLHSPLSDLSYTMQLHSHTDMFVELHIIHIEVTEWH
jgi:hypothetical protein